MINNLLKSKKAQTSALMIVLLFLAASLVFVAAENLTNSPSEEVIDLCESVSCEDSTLECPDGFISSCSNSCDSKSGECSDCTLSCEGHEVIQPPNTTSEPSKPPLENTTVLPTSNETQELPPRDDFGEPNETIVGNETEKISNESDSTDPIQDGENSGIIQAPNLNIEIVSENKITRGGENEIQATITNNGNLIAINVLAEWKLPTGFVIVSGNEKESCGDLNVGEQCVLNLILETSTSTQVGNNEIKLSVSYNE